MPDNTTGIIPPLLKPNPTELIIGIFLAIGGITALLFYYIYRFTNFSRSHQEPRNPRAPLPERQPSSEAFSAAIQLEAAAQFTPALSATVAPYSGSAIRVIPAATLIPDNELMRATF